MSLVVNYKNTLDFFHEHELSYMESLAVASNDKLKNKNGAGNDFLGWIDLPSKMSSLVDDINALAKEIRENSEVLVVIGIGGSYLGSRAVIESFLNPFAQTPKKGSPVVVYAGHNISGHYHKELLEFLDGKDFYVNVISKSGTTTEPAVAFRMLKEYAEERYGVDGAAKRIIATTDKARGALKTLATENGYRTYVIDDDVGGRFSVYSPVGLVPIAAAGVDIKAMLEGAAEMAKITESNDMSKNPSMLYAVLRNCLYNKGYTTEVLVNYIPRLAYISEWWKQLYGESEGKDNKGIFPASVNFSTDLHSLGQYIQDGRRNIFETVIQVMKEAKDVQVKEASNDLDGLNYLKGKSLHEVNTNAMYATVMAHVDGKVPNAIVQIDEINAYNIGALLYFFEKACGISGYIVGVNPFDQPGVEAYKKNMFALLGKPGFEEQGKILKARIDGQ